MLVTVPQRKREAGKLSRPRKFLRVESDSARQAITGSGTNTQVVPNDVFNRRTQQISSGSTSMSINRARSKYYYDKWRLTDTRTDPVYPRPEMKILDTNIGLSTGPSSIISPGVFYNLNVLVRGTAQNNRIGSLVKMRSVYYQFVLNLGSTPVPTAVRHLIVYDRQSNQGQPTIANLFADANNPLTSPLNDNYIARFLIIADDRTTLSPTADEIRIISNFYRMNCDATFGDATNEATTGNLFVFFVSDKFGANAPTVYGTWRIKFYDN